jgi:hypothetical protein
MTKDLNTPYYPPAAAQASQQHSPQHTEDDVMAGLILKGSGSRFSTWNRESLEKLAEDALAELDATREELAVALKGWRNTLVTLTSKEKQF